MSVSIITYPALVSLALNPVPFKFSTDNYTTTPGVAAQNRIYFPHSSPSMWLIDGDSFDICWGDFVKTISVVTTPDQSGTQIREYTGTNFNAWLQETRSLLEMDYDISNDFTLTGSLDNILFAAKEEGYDGNITLDNEPAAKINCIQTVPGVDEVARSFFYIIQQIWVQYTNYYTQLEQKNEDLLSVDSDSEAYNNISEIIKPYLYTEFEFPETTSTEWVRWYNIMKSYCVRYGEQYGTTPTIGGIQKSPTFYALNGCIPPWKQSEYYSAGSTFWDRMPVDKKFLTWQPAIKYIDRIQPEKLYWIAWEPKLTKSPVRIRINCYYYNSSGVFTSTTVQGNIQYVNYLDVYEIKVGYDVLNTLYNLDQYFNQYNGGDVEGQYYTVQVVRKAGVMNGTLLSEKRYFYLDTKEYPYVRYFMFLNSLGGIDTFRCTGAVELTDDYDRSFVTQAEPAIFDPDFQTEKPFSINSKRKYKANTGWLTEEAQEWLQDMLVSKAVYRVNEDATVLVPVNITSTSIRKNADGESPAFQHEFEYSPTEYENAYALPAQTSSGDYSSADYNPTDFSTM